MIFIVTALHCEAKPLIEKYKLKKNSVYSKLDLFENEEIKLIVSGIGKIRSAVATTMLLSQSKLSSDSVVVNLGCCGSASQDFKIGEMIYICKIRDHSNGRDYFPDPILRQGLKEAVIESYDMPVEKSKIEHPKCDLVDMEASGFFQAANMFVDVHRIYCLKVVSDFLELSHISKEFISSLIENNIVSIEHIFSLFAKFHKADLQLLQSNEVELLGQVGSVLKLTETQSHEFFELARSAKVRDCNLIESLSQFTASEIKSKSDNKDVFKRVRQILSQ